MKKTLTVLITKGPCSVPPAAPPRKTPPGNLRPDPAVGAGRVAADTEG